MISGTTWNFRACNGSLESSQQMEKDGVWRISISVTVPELFAYMCTYYDIILLYGKKCIILVIRCCAKLMNLNTNLFELVYIYLLTYLCVYLSSYLFSYLLTTYLLIYLFIYV